MSQPKPATSTLPQLTKTGKPRKRAPGAGRPALHRQHHLSRVDLPTLQALQTLASAWQLSQTATITRLALTALQTLHK